MSTPRAFAAFIAGASLAAVLSASPADCKRARGFRDLAVTYERNDVRGVVVHRMRVCRRPQMSWGMTSTGVSAPR